MSELQKLQNTPGILGVHTQAAGTSPPDDLYGCAIRVALAAGEDLVIVLTTRKVVVCLWPEMSIAVEVIPGHPVNKSLTRMLKRMGRRLGGLGVQSGACASPPAASSNTMDTSSPSPEASTVPTGDSQAERLNPANDPS